MGHLGNELIAYGIQIESIWMTDFVGGNEYEGKLCCLCLSLLINALQCVEVTPEKVGQS